MSGRDRDERQGAMVSADEAALWDYVTRNVERNRAKPHVRVQGSAADHSPQSPVEPVKPDRRVTPERLPAPAPPPKRTAPPPPEPVRPIVLERRKARRIAKGSEEIDGRLDLHGMTQDEAHRALELFIRRAHNDGLRTVIVITGKGGAKRDDDHTGTYSGRERGVLRRMVPLWLDGATLRPIVIGYSNAHVRHGGGGALYVMLRKSGK